jgi:hypothetical protein
MNGSRHYCTPCSLFLPQIRQPTTPFLKNIAVSGKGACDLFVSRVSTRTDILAIRTYFGHAVFRLAEIYSPNIVFIVLAGSLTHLGLTRTLVTGSKQA